MQTVLRDIRAWSARFQVCKCAWVHVQLCRRVFNFVYTRVSAYSCMSVLANTPACKCMYVPVCIWECETETMQVWLRVSACESECVRVWIRASVWVGETVWVDTSVWVSASVRAYECEWVRLCKRVLSPYEFEWVHLCEWVRVILRTSVSACECECVRIWMHASVSACEYECMRVWVHASVSALSVSACEYVWACARVSACAYQFVWVYAYERVCVYVHARTCVRECAWACVRAYLMERKESHSNRKLNSRKILSPKLFKIKKLHF